MIKRKVLEKAILDHEKWMRSHDLNNSFNKPENKTDRALMVLACKIKRDGKVKK